MTASTSPSPINSPDAVQITATYHPGVFNTADIAAAKAIILTPDGVNTTEERWQKETPYLLDLMVPLNITEQSIVLDYGCGIGRLSKALIEKFNCMVVGVDISPTMRSHAVSYVSSPRFRTWDPRELSAAGIKFDAAIAVWVLQHCLAPAADVASVKKMLKRNGQLFVVNEKSRFVPAKEYSWIDDGQDVAAMLQREFAVLDRGGLDPILVPASAMTGAYWARYGNGGE